MCNGMGCSYEKSSGDCSIRGRYYPDDAACRRDEREESEAAEAAEEDDSLPVFLFNLGAEMMRAQAFGRGR